MGDERDERVLVLALFAGDKVHTACMLESIGVTPEVCDDIAGLCRGIEQGAAAAVLAEEVLVPAATRLLVDTLQKQPPWSDVPLILSTVEREPAQIGLGLAAALGRIANLTLLDRPVSRRGMESAIRSALRARRRQLEVRALLQDLERTSRMKDEFLAIVSHELRTPLNAILGWSNILQEPRVDPRDVTAGAEAIGRNARAQARLIEDLLDVSSIIGGKLKLDLEFADPAIAVKNAVEAIQPTASLRGVGLEFIHGRTGQVRLDATRLQQIAWNLLSNAVKFTPRGGQVEASLMRLDDRLELVVRDTGCGIAPDFLPYVFERFRQQDSTTTRRHGGLGLGLAIVKNLAELHGGWVSVESAGQGRGTTFRVSLPTDSVETRHAVPAEGSSRGEGTSRITANRERLDGVRIVVVDDDADARELMETVLIQAGAEVKTAAASSEGLQAIAELRPHLVLADIAMPEEDGYTFVRRLRNRAPEAGGATPAIAVTACAREEDRARALASGYTRHMSKPVDFAQLVTEVAHLARAGACAS